MAKNLPVDAPLPHPIGPYRFLRLLGKGAMGAVYEVSHEHLGVHRALKLFDTEGRNVESLRKRFLAEGKLLARLDHPRLVRVHDLAFDEADGTPYFTMDLVVGPDGRPRNLADAQEAGAAQEDRLATWYADMRDALAAVHAAGIVHRDIKPENILVGKDGHAVLSDFGISRIVDDRLRQDVALTRTMVTGEATSSRHVLGTVMYLAPDVRLGGDPTPASDYWSLGMTFFRLLTGMWYEPGPRAFDLLLPFDPAWKQLFESLLAQDPARRSMPPLARCAGPHGSRPKWIVAGVVILLFGLAAAMVFLWVRSKAEEPPFVDVTDAFSATPDSGAGSP